MRTVNAIVIHWSASGDVSAKTIDGWHKARGMAEIGYNKVIRKSGQAEMGRAEELVPAHTKNFNQNSLGVCLTGGLNDSWYPTPEQLFTLNVTLKNWQGKYGITTSQIFFHRDKGQTACPGPLNKADILNRLKGGEDELDEQARADIKQIYKHFDTTVDPLVKRAIHDLDILVPRSENLLKAVEDLTEAVRVLATNAGAANIDSLVEEIRERLKE